jgi:hypothetical protein
MDCRQKLNVMIGKNSIASAHHGAFYKKVNNCILQINVNRRLFPRLRRVADVFCASRPQIFGRRHGIPTISISRVFPADIIHTAEARPLLEH